jgi:hypothetical protein
LYPLVLLLDILSRLINKIDRSSLLLKFHNLTCSNMRRNPRVIRLNSYRIVTVYNVHKTAGREMLTL